MIAVIDYGMGNLRSVEKALESVGAKAKIVSKPKDLAGCNKLVLPGVGAFGDAMKELKSLRFVDPIKDAIKDGKLFLGLCLGMQLLFDRSDEAPGVKGLGVLKGEVKKFNFSRSRAMKVPHMGWNNIVRCAEQDPPGDDILSGVPDGSYMYFVHSYFVLPRDKGVGLTKTDYGIDFISGVRKGNVYGFQFHPEKSQKLGLKILENFIRLR